MAKIVLYIINPEKYFERVIRILKTDTKGKNVVYVTTNKPYNYLINMFEKRRLKHDEIFFIDCISKHIKEAGKEAKNCIFLESPQNLTAISIAISESVKNLPKGKTVLLLDSMSVLLMYNDATTIGRFSNFIISRMRFVGIDMIVLALESDVDKDIIKQVTSFSDEVVKR